MALARSSKGNSDEEDMAKSERKMPLSKIGC
jgi:hypothetical protein